MGFVYLIGEINSDNKYKIGSTRAKNINKRLKQLQTGNSNELFIKSFYETDKPFKLETMLHNRFVDRKLSTWASSQNIINSLKENPYF